MPDRRRPVQRVVVLPADVSDWLDRRAPTAAERNTLVEQGLRLLAELLDVIPSDVSQRLLDDAIARAGPAFEESDSVGAGSLRRHLGIDDRSTLKAAGAALAAERSNGRTTVGRPWLRRHEKRAST